MKILKVFNNNAVAATSEEMGDIVVIGLGIGFQKQKYDTVDESKIEKTYIFKEDAKQKFEESLKQVPSRYFELTTQIVNMATVQLHTEFDSEIFISISDHMAFAIKRKEENIYLPNVLLEETKVLYRNEYDIGLWTIRYIKDNWGIELEDDEAGYIALHLVNYSLNNEANNASKVISFTKDMLLVIQVTYQVTLEKDTLAYTRLSTHLKFLAERIFRNEETLYQDTTASLREVLYCDDIMHQCIQRIDTIIKKKYNYQLSPDDQTFLIIHIKNNLDRLALT